MDIGTIEALLDFVPEDKLDICIAGFTHPHSWRGIYAEAAVEPSYLVTVSEMKATIERLLIETFYGWKGGDFTYYQSTPLHLSHEGYSEDMYWDEILVAIMRLILPPLDQGSSYVVQRN